ncbi:MAG: hypothetical protein J1E35_06105 [Lachnospiraceae bacterium]|nr:hypothetical protein [Lachnospiraceae bacterium]
MNYFRLLWRLYQQKQNVKKSREQIERLQKKRLGKLLRFSYEHSSGSTGTPRYFVYDNAAWEQMLIGI